MRSRSTRRQPRSLARLPCLCVFCTLVLAISQRLPCAQLTANSRARLVSRSEFISFRRRALRAAPRRAIIVRGVSPDEDAEDAAQARDLDRHRKLSESKNPERINRSQQRSEQINPLSRLWEFLWQPIVLTPPTIAGALIILWASISGVTVVSQMLPSDRASGVSHRLPLLSLQSGALTRKSQSRLDIPDDRLLEMELDALTWMQERQSS
eukprot:TRINITY_DN77274_c0_g1_i1.p1 TRINITY_DN77274_c0_g1~~TRINITY_DN77274_c0_g1_i1.p1  ORF type:complete len:210 (+),score=15.31 TRINITY_DN77274_c0_g1_i1:56-685(+)